MALWIIHANFLAMKLLILAFLINSVAYAKNWGHLLTGTTETLQKGEVTVGTLITGVGVNDYLTLGVSPMAYLGYSFISFIARAKTPSYEGFEASSDFFYFDSDSSSYEDSDFDQTSWFLKLNGRYEINRSVSIFLSYGHQYFINENSPYSFRPDPQGKWRTFRIKSDENFYSRKLRAFDLNPRDPSTESISIMPSFSLGESIILNLEYGLLGFNYEYPMEHEGLSATYQASSWDLSLGYSRSYRETPFLGLDEIYHTESKFQYYF